MAPLSRTLLALASCLFSVSALVIPPLGGSITNVKIGPNTDGKAVCASGTVSVTVSATNAKIAQQNPKDQFELSEIIQEFVSVNSDLVARNIIGTQPVQSSFNIYGTLCYPNSAPDIQSVKTLQILSHGAGLDRSYWDVASGNSYVGAAATAGYATFAYDRLGVGQSSHPDPIQVVQPATEVEILNQLLQGFKTGKIGAQKFANVVGVGHSVGSVIQTAHDAKYPNQFNATVITGLATNFPALSYTIIGTTPQIAAQANPSKFSGLPSGYIIEPNTIAFQQPFFRYPNFDPKVFQTQFQGAQPLTLGQLFTLAGALAPAAAHTKPVDVVIGQNDLPFCQGDCLYPSDQTVLFQQAFYPAAAAGSQKLLIPNTGHLINDHLSAGQAFTQINNFVKNNQL